MDIMKGFKKAGIFLGIIVALLGIIFLIWPKEVIVIIDWTIGGSFLLAGIIGIFKVAKGPAAISGKILRMIPSVLFVILAFYLLLFPVGATSMLGVLVGIFAIAAAFNQFGNCSVAKAAGEKFSPYIIMGITNLLLGVLMFYSAFALFSFMVIFIGAYMVVFGIMIMFSSFKLKGLDTKV